MTTNTTPPPPSPSPVAPVAARAPRWRHVVAALASSVGGIIIMNHNAIPPR